MRCAVAGRVRRWAALALALGSVLAACRDVRFGNREPAAGEGPGGRPMRTATETAVGMPAATTIVYPVTARSAVADSYFGTRVEDPYRWLEDLDSPAVRDWVAAQNQLSQARLAALPQRAWLEQRLRQLWHYERFGVPVKRGSHYFFLHNDGRQEQSVLLVAEHLADGGRVLADPHALQSDDTLAITEFAPDVQGNVVAFAVAEGGSDWQTWHFRRVSDGSDLPGLVRFTKFAGVSWARDGSGVYYSRYPALPDGRGDDAARPAVYFHRLAREQSEDRLVYEVRDHPDSVPVARVTEDGRYLIVTLHEGYERDGVDVIDLRRADVPVQRLFSAWDARYSFIGAHREELYFQTTSGAPLGRVIGVDARAPALKRTVVPEGSNALEEASYVGGRIVARYVEDAHDSARLYDRGGRPRGRVPLPGAGRIEGFHGEGGLAETFFSYTDYLTPPKIFRFDVAANESREWRATPAPRAAADFVTEQVFYLSKDGTRVPMYITHRRDLVRDGNQPLLLHGYGGFDVSLTPVYRPSVEAWLEMGGIYAEANLRGGGEYGEAWHRAGTLANKQHAFDDFIAAAEYLISARYTRSARLGIHGRSNGGLLVGAVLTQRPELFGAALPAVGVLDMLRYQRASGNARQWASDYGLAEDPEQFRTLYAYSPVQNVKKGVCYPPTLITTADHDDRVVPWHSYKFAAALQAAQLCGNPILIRIETRAGHGAGKPGEMQIEDFVDQWAFLANALGLPVPAASP